MATLTGSAGLTVLPGDHAIASIVARPRLRRPIVGTARFVADPSTDLFKFGCRLLDSLLGECPFSLTRHRIGGDPLGVLLAVLHLLAGFVELFAFWRR